MTNDNNASDAPLVSIHWLDSYTEAGWVEDITPSDKLTVTFGLLIAQSKEWVTLAMTSVPGKAPYWGNTWHIPRKMVRNIKVIQEHPEC